MFIKQSHFHDAETSNSGSFSPTNSELNLKALSYQALYDNLPTICFAIDPAGVILFANQFGAQRLGYSQDELISQPIFKFFHPQDLQKCEAEFSRLGSSDRTSEVAKWETRLACQEGGYVWVIAKACPLRTPISEGQVQTRSLTSPQLPEINATNPTLEIRENSTFSSDDLLVTNSMSPIILLICEETSTFPPVQVKAREQKQRFHRQNQILVELAKSNSRDPKNLKNSVNKITEVAAEILEAEKASVWLYNDERTQLKCIDLYEKNTCKHWDEIRLFSMINSGDLESNTVEENGGLSGLIVSEPERNKVEFLQQGIARLHIPIWLGDRIGGAMCFEREDRTNLWDEDEEGFAINLASFVAMAVEDGEKLRLEVTRREQQQNLLSQYYEQQEQRVEERTAELTKANQQLQEEIALRKEVEAALRRQQQEQQIIFDSVPAMIWQKDINNKLFFINKAAAIFMGLSVEEVKTKSLDKIQLKKSGSEDLEILSSGIAKLGIIEKVEMETGESRWLRTDKIPYRDETEKIVGMIVFAVDITHMVRVEKELRNYRDRLETLVAERTVMYQRAMRHFYWSNQQLQQEISDRQKIEEALKRERNLFVGGPVTVFRCLRQENWPVEYISPNITQFGYSADEFTSGKLLYSQIVHPGDRERLAAEVQAYSQAGVFSFEQDYRIVTASGESRWVYDFTVIVRNEAGEITHYEGYILDITERKQGEDEQQRSLSLLHATLESTADAILAVSITGEVLTCNQKFRELWNLSDEVLNSRNWFEQLPHLAQQVKNPEGSLEKVTEIYSQPEAEISDLVEFKDGRICDRYSKPIRVGSEIIGRVWCFHDITAHKQAQATLRDRERRLQAIFDCAFQFIGLLQPDGIMLAANKTALDFAGIQLSDVIGCPFWETCWWRISPSTQEQLKVAIAAAAAGEFIRYEVDILGANNQIATIDFSLKPVKDEKGQVVLLIPEGRDITESKQAQRELRLQAERERLLAQIQNRIRSSLDLDAILNTAVAEVREFLGADRVLIYRFQSEWTGEVVVESVGPQSNSILGSIVNDPCFRDSYVDRYQEGRIRAIEDIYSANLGQCHLNLLENFQVRANLVVPIVESSQMSSNDRAQASKLWGLLIAHHCSGPRHWQAWETDFLKQLANQVAIAIQQSQLYQQLQAANQELQHLASLDGLTKIANRRRFDEVINQEWQRLFAEPMRLSLILCDIDCFKAYNDTYGHQAGDACLQQVADAIQDACQDSPPESLYLVARYGGEEFAVILPNTDIDAAAAVAEQIRDRVQALGIVHEQSLVAEWITLSLGVASTSVSDCSPTQLIAAADRALYEAKSQGRDRVVRG